MKQKSLNTTLTVNLQDSDDIDNKLRIGENLNLDASLDGSAAVKLDGKVNNRSILGLDLGWEFDAQNLSNVDITQLNQTLITLNNTEFNSINEFVNQFNPVDLLNLVLEILINSIADKLAGINLPLLGEFGEDLEAKAREFLSIFQTILSLNLVDVSAGKEEDIKQTLFEILSQELDILQDGDDVGEDMSVNDIFLEAKPDGYIFAAKLGGELDSFTIDLTSNLGVADLAFNIPTGVLEITPSFTFDLKFGLDDTDNSTPQFFLDTTSDTEITIKINASVINLAATGNIGFIKFGLTDKGLEDINIVICLVSLFLEA